MEQSDYGTDHSTPFSHAIDKRLHYSDSQIEERATALLRELWQNRESMWGWSPTDPTIVIDPAKGLELLGFDFFLEEDLTTFHSSVQDHVQVAGVIDKDARRVYLSKRFPMSVLSFTAAHELGHAVLHEISEPLHRDRPLNGESISREPKEREADKFATYFLMPAKLVRARFIELFGTDNFILTEDTAFALSCSSLSELKKKHRTRRDISRLLAGTKSYSGRNLYSLADQFRVSVEAMAIRLEELALIQKPAAHS